MKSRALTCHVLIALFALAGCGAPDPVTPTLPPAPGPAPVPPGPGTPVVTLASFSITPHSDSLRPGDTLRFVATAVYTDSTPRPLAVTWTATGGTMDTTGLFTAGNAIGTYLVLASCACAPADSSAAVAAVDSARVAVVAPPLSVDSVPLRLHRMDGGSGDVLVSNGIPLPPGWLSNPAAAPPVRITIGGTEVPSYVEVLKGKHKDGSVMSVLVQFVWPAAATGDATFELGAPSGVPSRTKVDLNGEMPAAAALPIDPEYLVSTLVVGPTVSRFNAPQAPSFFTVYEAKFDDLGQRHWETYGANWGALNYYDRVQSHYAFWVRTGNPVLWERASRIAVAYRKGYIEANNYGVAEWWTYLEGVALHYWLTGDDSSRKAVYMTAENIDRSRGGEFRIGNNTSHPYNDSRTQSKVLGAKVLAYRLESPAAGGIQDWKSAASRDLGWILNTQDPAGPILFQNICGASNNFMTGMLSSVFIEYFEHLDQDARIPGSIQRFLDWLWDTQWRPADQVYNYYSKDCGADGGMTPAWDLNGFFLESYGWLYARTGDPKYLERGEATFAGLVAKTWFDNTKMYNQAFNLSWRYLAYRR